MDASDIDATLNKIYALAEIEKYESALREAQTALASNPHHQPLLVAVGYLLINTERAGQALPYLQQAIGKDPADHWAIALLAFVHEIKGELSTAIQLYEECLKLAPEEPKYYLDYANVLAQDANTIRYGNMRKAFSERILDYVHHAISLAPEDPDIVGEAAHILRNEGEQKEARQLVIAGLSLAPQHEGLRYLLAELDGVYDPKRGYMKSLMRRDHDTISQMVDYLKSDPGEVRGQREVFSTVMRNILEIAGVPLVVIPLLLNPLSSSHIPNSSPNDSNSLIIGALLLVLITLKGLYSIAAVPSTYRTLIAGSVPQAWPRMGITALGTACGLASIVTLLTSDMQNSTLLMVLSCVTFICSGIAIFLWIERYFRAGKGAGIFSPSPEGIRFLLTQYVSYARLLLYMGLFLVLFDVISLFSIVSDSFKASHYFTVAGLSCFGLSTTAVSWLLLRLFHLDAQLRAGISPDLTLGPDEAPPPHSKRILAAILGIISVISCAVGILLASTGLP